MSEAISRRRLLGTVAAAASAALAGCSSDSTPSASTPSSTSTTAGRSGDDHLPLESDPVTILDINVPDTLAVGEYAKIGYKIRADEDAGSDVDGETVELNIPVAIVSPQTKQMGYQRWGESVSIPFGGTKEFTLEAQHAFTNPGTGYIVPITNLQSPVPVWEVTVSDE